MIYKLFLFKDVKKKSVMKLKRAVKRPKKKVFQTFPSHWRLHLLRGPLHLPGLVQLTMKSDQLQYGRVCMSASVKPSADLNSCPVSSSHCKSLHQERCGGKRLFQKIWCGPNGTRGISHQSRRRNLPAVSSVLHISSSCLFCFIICLFLVFFHLPSIAQHEPKAVLVCEGW